MKLDENDRARAKEIGERVRLLRTKYLSISSQLAFAEKVGVTRGAVANWEVGKGISRVNLYRIAETFQASVAWLTTGTGDPIGLESGEPTMGPRSRAVHDYTYQIHLVDEGGDIIKTLAELDVFGMAKAAFEAALQDQSWSIIELRNGARVVETAKTGGYDSTTKLVELQWRKR